MRAPFKNKRAQFGPDALVGIVLVAILGLGGVFFLNVFVNGLALQGLLAILDTEIDQRCFYILLPLVNDEYIRAGATDAELNIGLSWTIPQDMAIGFNLDAWEISYGWQACTSQDGGIAGARAFCKCKNYADVAPGAACYKEKTDTMRYKWGATCGALRGVETSAGLSSTSVTKIKCMYVTDSAPLYQYQHEYFGVSSSDTEVSKEFGDILSKLSSSTYDVAGFPLKITAIKGYIATEEKAAELRLSVTEGISDNARICRLPVYSPTGRSGVAELYIEEEEG
jgi:hypothetical protein